MQPVRRKAEEVSLTQFQLPPAWQSQLYGD